MHFARPIFSLDQRRFGRGPMWTTAMLPESPAIGLGDDLRLFATTFAAGFLFVSLLLA
jgi:hypothetical protein